MSWFTWVLLSSPFPHVDWRLHWCGIVLNCSASPTSLSLRLSSTSNTCYFFNWWINYCKWKFLTCKGWISGNIGSVLVCCSSPKYDLFSIPCVSLGRLSRRKLNRDTSYEISLLLMLNHLEDFQKADIHVIPYNN